MRQAARVQRLKEPFTRWPPMATLGRARDVELTRRFARALASELAAVGITLDFAPVLDVLTNAKNPAIGDRALSDSADDVAAHGRVIVETLQQAGIAAAGKHFPGHGDTGVDSHLELPVCDLPPDRIRAVEFVPFRAAIDARVAFMLTCHVLYPAFDEEHPATLSPAIVQALLRDELRFDGAILTDDLDMKAIADRYTIEETAVRAIRAGCDGLLICGGDYDRKARAMEALIRAAEDEKTFARRVEDLLGPGPNNGSSPVRPSLAPTRFASAPHSACWTTRSSRRRCASGSEQPWRMSPGGSRGRSAAAIAWPSSPRPALVHARL